MLILDCFGFSKPRNDDKGGEGDTEPTPNCHAELVLSISSSCHAKPTPNCHAELVSASLL